VIDSADPMSRVGAFFDVDRTIVSVNTGRLFLRDLRRRGEISFFRALRALIWMAKYHLSLIDLQWVATRLAGEMEGLSTSPTYVTQPIAETLGIEEVMSTRFEVDGGHFTGRLIGPACVGVGKVHWAEDLGARRQVDLGQSWFYTDSYTDMPMLERVGHRVVVNPDPRLKRIAKRRGWPVQDWRQPLPTDAPPTAAGAGEAHA
jgi:hypothetical protein